MRGPKPFAPRHQLSRRQASEGPSEDTAPKPRTPACFERRKPPLGAVFLVFHPPTQQKGVVFTFLFLFNIFFFVSFLLISTVDRSAWTRYRGVWGRRQPLIHLAEKNGRLDSSP